MLSCVNLENYHFAEPRTESPKRNTCKVESSGHVELAGTAVGRAGVTRMSSVCDYGTKTAVALEQGPSLDMPRVRRDLGSHTVQLHMMTHTRLPCVSSGPRWYCRSALWHVTCQLDE